MSGRTIKETHMPDVDDFMPTYELTPEQLEARFVQKQIKRELAMGKRFAENQAKASN